MEFSGHNFLPEPADTLTALHGLRTNSRMRPHQTDLSLSRSGVGNINPGEPLSSRV